MLDNLLKFLSNPPKEAQLKPSDARLALAALLVRVARADDRYDNSEIAAILELLQDRYGLSVSEAESVRAEAEALEAVAPDTVRFTKAIKAAVPYEDRRSVVEALWKVALADGHRAYEENGLLRLVTNLLGVNDRDSALVRQRVIAELGKT